MSDSKSWEERFINRFVREDYPFLGGLHYYWKNDDNVTRVMDFITKELHQTRQDTLEEAMSAVDVMEQAINKIDGIVSSDAGYEADIHIGLEKKKVREEYAKDWAKMIVEIYKTVHPLCHDCCGGNDTIGKLKQQLTEMKGEV
jgi:hypothetical protein